jgi:hypothetical protein
MRCTRLSSFSLTVLGVTLAAVGCGGSSSVTGPDEAPGVALGAAVVQGTVVGGSFAAPSGDVFALSDGSRLTVTVEGTSLTTTVDEEGEFILTQVPAGTITLIFEGPGVAARLTVSGLVDGQVLSLECQVTGSSVEVTTPAHTTPAKKTKITGVLEAKNGNQLVVGGHQVDASEVRKVWRGGSRTELEYVDVGEKVKVWGTLRGDGVLVAEEIKALSNGKADWVVLEGRVTSVVSSAGDIHANPNSGSGSCGTASAGGVHANPNSSSCPTLYVDGVKVKTNGSTKFQTANGGALAPESIRVGQHAYVEGWQEPGKPIVAAKVRIG